VPSVSTVSDQRAVYIHRLSRFSEQSARTALCQIAENARRTREKDEYTDSHDVQAGGCKDLAKAGIIDPGKALRAGLLVTAVTMAAGEPEKKVPPMPPDDVGMDF